MVPDNKSAQEVADNTGTIVAAVEREVSVRSAGLVEQVSGNHDIYQRQRHLFEANEIQHGLMPGELIITGHGGVPQKINVKPIRVEPMPLVIERAQSLAVEAVVNNLE